MEQPIGAESYTITTHGPIQLSRYDSSLLIAAPMCPLAATFRGSEDLTPESFSIKGKNARTVEIDEAVDVRTEKIRVRDREKWMESAKPEQFFTIAGYAPATMQMLLYRYWVGHGSPDELEIFPAGHVRIEPRGKATVTILQKKETLIATPLKGSSGDEKRCGLIPEGIWWRWSSVDAEFDHFEAILEGYEEALGYL